VADGLKRSTNLTLRAKLVHEARLLGINLSSAVEDGIERAVGKARNQQWMERNRGAMASYDASSNGRDCCLRISERFDRQTGTP
jgi:post-segregation antitoxin (ccd killing protein)